MSTKTLTTVLGVAVASSLAGAATAGENPFAMKELSSGYVQVAEAGKDTKEMVCGEGKCGGSMVKSPEMNCGAMMEKAKKAQESAPKAMEGKCAGMNMGGQSASPGQTSPTSPAPTK